MVDNSSVIGSRIAFVDAAKAICIFLMVVGHWTRNELLLIYIYSFHMPAFFTISGFLYKPHHWIKTILSFGIPILFYSSVNFAILIITDQLLWENLNFKYIVDCFLCYRYGLGSMCLFVGLWFLWALLGLRLLFGDIKFLGKIRKCYIPLSALVISYVSLENLFIDTNTLFRGWFIGCKTIQSLPFFCLGLYLREKKWLPQMVPLPIIMSLLLFSISIPIVNGRCGILETAYGVSFFLFSFNAMASTILLFFLVNYIPANQVCVTISKGTLFILGIHMPLINFIEYIDVIPEILNFIIPFLVILICYYPIMWLDCYCPILLGKMKK